MIVNNVNSSAKYYSNSVTATRYTGATTAVRGAQKIDAFTPSKAAQSFSEMLAKLKNAPEVREDKVAELEQQISSGQYFVSSADIASKILTNRY